MNDSRNIRIPVHAYESIAKYKAAESALLKKLNRKPEIEEVAAELKISLDMARTIEHWESDTVSISTLVGEDQESELEDFLPSDNESNPEESAINALMKEDLWKGLDKVLKEREKNVLIMRFGLGDNSPMTLGQVGDIFHVTRERIRQIEIKALRKLKNSSKTKALAYYLTNSLPATESDVTEHPESNVKKKSKTIAKILHMNNDSNVIPVKRTKNLYEMFEIESDKRESVIARLPKEYVSVLEKRWNLETGEIIENSEITREEKDLIYDVIFPDLKRIKDHPNLRVTPRKLNMSNVASFYAPLALKTEPKTGIMMKSAQTAESASQKTEIGDHKPELVEDKYHLTPIPDLEADEVPEKPKQLIKTDVPKK